jgi:signal transduction histidine kinase
MNADGTPLLNQSSLHLSWDMFKGLRFRLFASFAFVAIVAALSLTAVIRVFIPGVFADHLAAMERVSHPEMVRAAGDMDPRMAANSALNAALPIAVAASLLLGGIVGALTSRRLLAPIRDLQIATRRLAAGQLDQRSPVSSSTELAQLATDINHLGATLQAAEERRTRLIGDVMHELRTPLTVIDGYAEGLLDNITQPSEEVFAAIGDEVAKLKRLVGDLQLLSSLEEQPQLIQTPESLTVIAASVCQRLQNQYDSKEIRLVQKFESEPIVSCDRARIEQVITNLLGNALTYTPAGGTVTITAQPDNRMRTVKLEVHDTGIGIAPDDLAHVFERFYRVNGIERPPGGSGIGLAIASALVIQHGGTLTAASPGKQLGATFTMQLPLAAPSFTETSSRSTGRSTNAVLDRSSK